jgi:predicted transcriptional regulator
MSTNTEVIIDAMKQLSMKERNARVLAFILQNPESTQHEIERITDLRQPEVSNALKELKMMGFIRVSETIRAGFGRPTNVYTPAKTPRQIGKDLENIFIAKMQDMKENVRIIQRISASDIT